MRIMVLIRETSTSEDELMRYASQYGQVVTVRRFRVRLSPKLIEECRQHDLIVVESLAQLCFDGVSELVSLMCQIDRDVRCLRGPSISLKVFRALHDYESECRSVRSSVSLALARARGTAIGRPRRPVPRVTELVAQYGLRATSRMLGISRETIRRRLREEASSPKHNI